MSMEDIEAGCEGAVLAMKGWIDALARHDFGYLERVLAPDFQFTCPPEVIPGGRLQKAAFIEMDKNIHDSKIDFLKLTARRFESTVLTLVFAEVHEEVRGDLGPNMPSAAAMTEMVNGHVFAYASAWRVDEHGQWVCFSHNVLATVR
jgi:hypothetical protein